MLTFYLVLFWVHFFCFRIERLWRDVWTSVTHLYYDVLHSLEEEGLLDLSDIVHMFCVHYVFLPRLRDAFHTFTEAWDNHPLKSEGGLTPNQLWVLGHMQNPAGETEEDLQVCPIYTLCLAVNSSTCYFLHLY